MVTERARIDFPSRIGVWWASDSWAMPAAQAVARDIEAMGYGSLFLPETVGKECLTESAAFLAATDRLVVGTGIANIHVRLPSAAEAGARTLTALYPGRFVLGLGVSHGPLVERGMGGTYEKPLATMRSYLERMAAVPDAIEPGVGRPPRLLAALGPKMIELSGSGADGAHPYLVLPSATATTREILGPDKWIVSEQAVAIGGDDADQLRRAHDHLNVYSGLPNYQLVAAPGLRRQRSGPRWIRATGARPGRHGQRRRRRGQGQGAPRCRCRPRRGAGARGASDRRPAAEPS